VCWPGSRRVAWLGRCAVRRRRSRRRVRAGNGRRRLSGPAARGRCSWDRDRRGVLARAITSAIVDSTRAARMPRPPNITTAFPEARATCSSKICCSVWRRVSGSPGPRASPSSIPRLACSHACTRPTLRRHGSARSWSLRGYSPVAARAAGRSKGGRRTATRRLSSPWARMARRGVNTALPTPTGISTSQGRAACQAGPVTSAPPPKPRARPVGAHDPRRARGPAERRRAAFQRPAGHGALSASPVRLARHGSGTFCSRTRPCATSLPSARLRSHCQTWAVRPWNTGLARTSSRPSRWARRNSVEFDSPTANWP
jgi:hypothetical protein